MDAAVTREILKKVRQVELRTRRLVTDALAGEYHSVFKGRGMDFDEVREYTPGDEVRLIDWNVTARTGTPFIKKLREERELTILLAVDVSASGKFGSQVQSKRELAAEVASVLAFSAIRNRDKVGLLLFTDDVEQFIPPNKGRTHVLRVIREILFHQPRRLGTDVAAALDFINDVQRRRAVVFIISDFIESPAAFENLRRQLRLTNKRHDLVLLHLRDRHEETLPSIGLVTLEDPETGEVVEIDTNNRMTRESFEKLARQRMEQFRRAARQANVDTLELRTGEPYSHALYSFFPKSNQPEAGMKKTRRFLYCCFLASAAATFIAVGQTNAANPSNEPAPRGPVVMPPEEKVRRLRSPMRQRPILRVQSPRSLPPPLRLARPPRRSRGQMRFTTSVPRCFSCAHGCGSGLFWRPS